MGSKGSREGVVVIKQSDDDGGSFYTLEPIKEAEAMIRDTERLFISTLYPEEVIQTAMMRLEERGAIRLSGRSFRSSDRCDDATILGTMRHWSLVVEKRHEEESCVLS